MNLLGFTGTRRVTAEEVKQLLLERREWLATFDGFVTGACVGLDGFAGEWLFNEFPEKKHYVIVPANKSQVDWWWHHVPLDHPHYDNIIVREMPPGTNYRNRNQEIVILSTELFYCADAPELDGRSTRSSTWQTVRLARNKGIIPEGVILRV